MRHISLITSILIALGSIPTGASAQNVYRCGSSYSQKPCPDAVVVDVEDTRSNSQKVEAHMYITGLREVQEKDYTNVVIDCLTKYTHFMAT